MDKNIAQNMSSQEDNEKHQPRYSLRNLNVFPKVRAHLNISSVSVIKHRTGHM
jgi:hypothetical protein